MNKKIAVCFLLLSTYSAMSFAVTVPHTFVSGQPAVAADVNDNFSVLAAAITKLEGGTLTATDVAGTYKLVSVSTATMGKNSASGGSGSFGSKSGESESTVVINANGTLTFTGSRKGTSTTVICNASSQSVVPSCGGGVNTQSDDSAADNGSGTWSLDNGGHSITITPQNDPAVTVQMAKGAALGFFIQTTAISNNPPGREFQLNVLIKQ